MNEEYPFLDLSWEERTGINSWPEGTSWLDNIICNEEPNRIVLFIAYMNENLQILSTYYNYIVTERNSWSPLTYLIEQGFITSATAETEQILERIIAANSPSSNSYSFNFASILSGVPLQTKIVTVNLIDNIGNRFAIELHQANNDTNYFLCKTYFKTSSNEFTPLIIAMPCDENTYQESETFDVLMLRI